MPPVYVGCVASPESYAWAGRNGFHVMVSPFLLDSTARQRGYLNMYRDALAAAGHNPANFEVVANYHLALVVHERDIPGADQYFYNYMGFVQQTAAPRRLDRAAYASYGAGGAMARDVDEMRATRTIMGTPAQCVARMGDLARACGITGWMLHINYGGVPHERVVEQMHLLRESVVPSLVEGHGG
jgi:alkanesulfonate monooxygenase SsuD/methylene tetrahydromethanopterin reductase-like flavin-dependent oxidoreductase (luciferase family)